MGKATTTVLMMANQNKRASSTIVNSTASGANPEPTVKAAGDGIADWPLEKKFLGFCSAMFGFFAFFMLMPGSAEITKAYLKQVTAMLCGHLALFVNVTFFSPVAKFAWYPQIILQVALVAMGLKLINDN